jgi:hypothetical protein
MKNSPYLPAYEDGTECSEKSAYKIQTPGNNPEERIQHLQHGESSKSRKEKTSLEINFAYSGNMEICCVFKHAA